MSCLSSSLLYSFVLLYIASSCTTASRTTDLNALVDTEISQIAQDPLFRDTYFVDKIYTNFSRSVDTNNNVISGQINFLNSIINGLKTTLVRHGAIQLDENVRSKAILSLSAGPFNFSSNARTIMIGTARNDLLYGNMSVVKFEVTLNGLPNEFLVRPRYTQGFNVITTRIVTKMDPAMANLVKESAFEGFNRMLRDPTNPIIRSIVDKIVTWDSVYDLLKN